MTVLPAVAVIAADYLVKQKTRVSVEFGSFQECYFESCTCTKKQGTARSH